ncbi:MAG: hypothetical protein ACI81S_000463 [Sphingobacteriales bacterium]|jgi:hypothetical protein
MNKEQLKNDFLGTVFSLTHKTIFQYGILYLLLTAIPLILVVTTWGFLGGVEIMQTIAPLIGETNPELVDQGTLALANQLAEIFSRPFGMTAFFGGILLMILASCWLLSTMVKINYYRLNGENYSFWNLLISTLKGDLFKVFSFVLILIGFSLTFLMLLTLLAKMSLFAAILSFFFFLFVLAKLILAIPVIVMHEFSSTEGINYSWALISNKLAIKIMLAGLVFMVATLIISLVVASINALIGTEGIPFMIIGILLNLISSLYFNSFLLSGLVTLFCYYEETVVEEN